MRGRPVPCGRPQMRRRVLSFSFLGLVFFPFCIRGPARLWRPCLGGRLLHNTFHLRVVRLAQRLEGRPRVRGIGEARTTKGRERKSSAATWDQRDRGPEGREGRRLDLCAHKTSHDETWVRPNTLASPDTEAVTREVALVRFTEDLRAFSFCKEQPHLNRWDGNKCSSH